MRVGHVPSAMGLVSRLALRRAQARGIDVEPLLAGAGLTRARLGDPKSRIPVRGQIEFLNHVADALGEDMLGHELALDFDPREAGLIHYVFASSATLLELFERGARYAAVVNEGFLQECIDGRHLRLVIRYSGVPRQADRHQIEFWVTALVRFCRQLTRRQIRPARVRFTHFRGRGYARLSRFLGCPVEFGARSDEILFARESRQVRVIQADPYLNRVLLEVCEQALKRRSRAGSFAVQMENVVAPLLPHGEARVTAVAARLGVSPRTFARRLAAEGLTFSRLLRNLRLGLARRYLLHEGVPISKVAWLLGYREVAAFSHAFRRWTGSAPSEVARSAVLAPRSHFAARPRERTLPV